MSQNKPDLSPSRSIADRVGWNHQATVYSVVMLSICAALQAIQAVH